MIREIAAKARELGFDSIEVDVRDLRVRIRAFRRAGGDVQYVHYDIDRADLESQVGEAVEAYALKFLTQAMRDA